MAGIRARRKAERPGQILDAALEEFVLKGYAATRLEDVAARAGVTKGTIYVYFDSKERVFESVVREMTREPARTLQEADLPWTDDLSHDIAAYLDRIYGFCGADQRSREVLRLLIAEASRFPDLVDRHFDDTMRPVVERLRARLAAAMETGDIPRSDLSTLPEVVLGPVLALDVMRLLFAGRLPLDPERFLATHRAVLLDGAVGRSPESRDGWTAWRACPDPAQAGLLTAPLGPGLFAVREAGGAALLFGAAPRVAGHLAGLLADRPEDGPARELAIYPPGALAYRTRPAPDLSAARALAAQQVEADYRFGRLDAPPDQAGRPVSNRRR